MATHDNLFDTFPPVSKQAWLAKVEKDLKGKPFQDLQWQLEEEIEIAPFYHPEDGPFENPSLKGNRPDNDWEIGEYIEVEDFREANDNLLEGLNGGVEAPLLRLRRPLDGSSLEQLLQGVKLDLIKANFEENYSAIEPWAIFRYFTELLQKQGTNLNAVGGSIDFDPLLDWSNPPIDKLAELIKYCARHMPQFRILQANAQRFHSGPDSSSVELAYTLAKGSEYLARLTALGIPPETVNAQMQFAISISKSYFVEIAKIRALRLLWANVMKGYGAPRQAPFLVAHFAEESQDENPNTNLIRSSTQAMSAVIGGVNRLYVLPANRALKEPATAFTRRSARNLQHILKMESHLHQVIDPGAGSFYIEKLTDKLADQAWAKFQKMEATGEFQ